MCLFYAKQSKVIFGLGDCRRGAYDFYQASKVVCFGHCRNAGGEFAWSGRRPGGFNNLHFPSLMWGVFNIH